MKATILTTLFAVSLAGCALTKFKYQDHNLPPENYEATIKAYLENTLKDPESVRYHEFGEPVKGYFKQFREGFFLDSYDVTPGYVVTFVINAKNGYGGYVGKTTYRALFRGEDMLVVCSENERGFSKFHNGYFEDA